MHAEVYRMVTPDHLCPFGLKTKYLLNKKGIAFEDHQLRNRQEIDDFKDEYHVKTTPQIFIDGKRIGGYDDLEKYFGSFSLKQGEKSYQPIIAVFGASLLIAIGVIISNQSLIFNFQNLLNTFVAFAMMMLASLKFRDLFSFSNNFITYDLLGRHWIPYSYLFPVFEFLIGFSMLTGIGQVIFGSFGVFMGMIGMISVYKAVYIEKRDLKCACVGGNSNVPLGAISMLENIIMFAMGAWMIST